MSQRRLVSIRRFVGASDEERARYDALWAGLHDAATARGAHAWRFASADAPGVFLEFLEFGPESDVRADPATLEAIRALHAGFGQVYPMPQTLEEWSEAPLPPAPATPEAGPAGEETP